MFKRIPPMDPDVLEELDNWDWEKFRREAAKDILCAIVSKHHNIFFSSDMVDDALIYTDELIKQLREEKK